jgi:hypothetical protein
MPELAVELAKAKGVKADPSTLSNFLIASGLSFKKKPFGQGLTRRGRSGGESRKPVMREQRGRLIFIDETGTITKMACLRGRSLKG